MFLGHEKSVTWSGCKFKDVESWFYRVQRLIYWNMFGMTRILPTVTASSVRGWEMLFYYTHTHKKKEIMLLPVYWANFPHLSLTVDYIRLLQGSYIISVALPPKITGRISVHSFILNKNLAAKLGTVTREGCNGNYIWMKIISGKLQIRQYIESPRQKTTQNPVNRAIKEIGITYDTH